jgi:hypothetical protein
MKFNAFGLPVAALSVRQPWAWAIIHAGKDIENRMWRRPNPGLNFRGPVCIHASTSMTQKEYHSANLTIENASASHAHSPIAHMMNYGCIIGTVEVIDVVKSSDSKWFQGPFPGLVGLVLANPHPIEPIRVAGAFGFFDWRARVTNGEPDPLPKWMLREASPKIDTKKAPQGSLL